MLLLINKGVFCDSYSQNLFGKTVTCYLMTVSDDFIKFSAITGPGNEKRKSVASEAVFSCKVLLT